MKCPKCRAVVPNKWKVCRCGYDFQGGDEPSTGGVPDSTKPIKHVSKPVYEKKDIMEEYREKLLKDTSYELTRKLPVEDLVAEVKGAEHKISEGSPIDTKPTGTEGLEGYAGGLSFHGSGTTLLGIHILNIFLTVVTLGFYYFWGKIKVRKYMYSQSEFEGDRFEFHGTGKELLLGWMKASLIIGLVLGGAELGKSVYPGIYSEIAGGLIIYMMILFLTPVALVLTQKYRFSRTSWRSIRFSFRGKTGQFLGIYVPSLILTTLTLGIYYYFLHHKTRKYLVDNAYFGDAKFEYDGQINALFKKFIKAIILSLFTLGIYWFWFAAERHNYYWSHTRFLDSRFRLDIKGIDYFKLKFINMLLLLFTFGIGYPFVQIRDTKFLYDHLRLEGDLKLDDIIQEAKTPSALGEEVADVLDLDLVGMDLGI